MKRILFICLGNICRSPAAEGVLLHKLHKKGVAAKYFVDSAGTGGWHVGSPADKRMQKAAEDRGIYLKSISRQISLNDFRDFDFILTMDNDNYERVNSLYKGLGKEFNVIIKPILTFARHTNLIEVPDPYYGGDDGFGKVLDLLEDACEGLIDELNLIM